MRQRILLGALGVLILIFVPVYWSVLTGSGTKDNLAGPKSLLPSLPPKGPATGGSDPAGPLLLKARDPVLDRDDLEGGMLLREIVRQAILLTAREEVGLSTRDASIREPFPHVAEPRNVPLEVVSRSRSNGDVEIVIFRQHGDQWESLWTGNWAWTGKNRYQSIVDHVEPLSRGDFVRVLEKAGFQTVASPAPRVSADVPQSIARLLNRLTIPAQFAALRGLHAEIRSHGESPELLGELARGYAMMGVLTEWLWSPAHKAFKARALLYAQRAINIWPQSSLALRNRAFARALIGFHRAALEDLAAAAALASRNGGAEASPDWVGLIQAYCMFDSDALDKAVANESQAEFVLLLQLMMAEVSDDDHEVWTAAINLAKAVPNCLRALDGAASFRELTTHRLMAALGPSITERALLDELREIPDLPPNVADCIERIEKGHRVSSLARNLGVTLPETTMDRRQIIEELRKASDNDHQDPSWQMLSQLLEEIDFMNAWRRIDVTIMLCVPADDEIDAVWPLVKHHPFAQFIASFRSDYAKRKEALQELAQSLDTAELELRESKLTKRLADMRMESLVPWDFYPIAHQDRVARDLCLSIQMISGRDFIPDLWQASPHMPFTIASWIRERGDLPVADAKNFEKQYAGSAAVHLALAKYYLDHKLEDDALRCYAVAGKLDPQRATFEALANLHLKRGDEAKWLATLEEFLTTEQFGLGHAQASVTIANRFIESRQWDKARPYAEGAAVSYSGWGLEKAAQCAEALQDWENAERYYAAESERYPESAALNWYMFCKRTGHGDEAAAFDFALKSLQRFDALGNPNFFGRGAVYWTSGKASQAAEVLKTHFDSRGNPDVGVYAALAMEEAGENEKSGQLLRKIADIEGGPAVSNPLMENFVLLAGMLSEDLANGGKGDLNFVEVDKLIDALTNDTDRTVLRYAVGCYLDHHGQSTRAIEYWRASLGDVYFGSWARTLTGFELCERGIGPESYKDLLWKKPDVKKVPAEAGR